MVVNWVVAEKEKRWASLDGVWDVVRIATCDWRLTEVVKLKAACGVRLVVMEHDHSFNDPKAATAHVQRLLRERSRVCRSDGIIGRGRPRKEMVA